MTFFYRRGNGACSLHLVRVERGVRGQHSSSAKTLWSRMKESDGVFIKAIWTIFKFVIRIICFYVLKKYPVSSLVYSWKLIFICSSVAEPPLFWAAPAPDGQGPGADSGSDLLGSAPGKKRQLHFYVFYLFQLTNSVCIFLAWIRILISRIGSWFLADPHPDFEKKKNNANLLRFHS